MKLEDLKVGQRARITYEGEVGGTCTNGAVISSGGSRYFPRGDMEGLEVELIEPEYIDGEIYRSARGGIYKFVDRNRSWVPIGSSTCYGFDSPARPLVRLVPES